MSLTPRRLSRVGAGVAIGTLTASSLLFISPAQAATTDLTPVDVNTSATRTGGSVTFLGDGVRVRTGPNQQTPRTDGASGTWNNNKAAGYFDLRTPLATIAAGEDPSLDWDAIIEGSPEPGVQLKVDFDGDGDVDGILVGEKNFDGNWWLSEPKGDTAAAATSLIDPTQPDYRKYYAPLDEWSSTFGSAKVVEGGFSLGSGAQGDGVITGMTFGDDSFSFSNDEVDTTKTLYRNDVDLTETRTAGSNTFQTNGGVRVKTVADPGSGNGQSKAAGYFPVGQLFSTVGEPTIKLSQNTSEKAAPSVQLRIDLNDDGNWDGTLVGERSYADGTGLYQGIATATRWWVPTSNANAPLAALAPSSDGGVGSQFNGTLAEWRAKLPANAKVLTAGWSLGSGVIGDTTIDQIKVGTTTFEFSGKNRLPVAQSFERTTRGSTTVAGTPTSVTLAATDPDAEALTYTVGEAEDGTVAVVNGVATYTPDAGFSGSDSFTYTATDVRGGVSAPATVSVTVTANGTPVVADADASTRTNDAVVIPLTASDPDDDDFAVTVSQPDDGSAELNQAGTEVTYTPDEDFDGTDAFTYTVTDDRGAEATADVTVTVAANGTPVVADASASTRTNDAVVIPLTASDPDDDDFTVTITQPDDGSAELNQAGTEVTYTPDEDFDGTDAFTYTVTDDRGAEATADVTVTVAPNRAPVATAVTGTTKAGKAVTVTLAATDADGDTITYAPGLLLSSVGTATVSGNKLTFTPGAKYAGTAVFGYTATDDRGAVGTSTVRIGVAKLASSVEIYRVNPAYGKVTTNSTVSVYATIKTDGKATPAGTVVNVYAKGKLVTTGVVNSTSKVKVTLPDTLPKGKATLKVELPSSSTVTGSSDSTAITVVKK